jgi:hypothetical protein
MTTIAGVHRLQLPDIDDVTPLGSQDQACIDELHRVLERYGALERFGITLLHQHFELGPNEVLVEAVDVDNRVLTIRPQKVSQLGPTIETSWRLDPLTGQQRCETLCERDRNVDGEEYHRRAHYTTR